MQCIIPHPVSNRQRVLESYIYIKKSVHQYIHIHVYTVLDYSLLLYNIITNAYIGYSHALKRKLY